ncbi:concanavalin A-like lectin/glucanase domain-containing protein [Sparassis latifolia]|uniref:Probable glycosidase n=1 Tax=Sparassis crispa TaxID=139825 RepID=A0A401GNM7_9APHY|nr:Probable glycosidase [Sparassis crispa]GBE83780.1 Probable glycosidase [Sparassis crispa]
MSLALVTLLPLLVSAISGVTAQQTCNSTSLCGSASPCCSSYGFCGSGPDFCYGGCDPLSSNTLDSCMPEPVCQDRNITFANFDRILTNQTYYHGNASEYDLVVNQGNIMNMNTSGGELAMLLTESNGGTRLSTTTYVHYGQMTARLTTGRWAGVVTAFITMSDIKDEIDWEFPGNQTTQGQTNYFWQGVIPATTAGEVTSNISDTYSNFHDYTIDWQPDTLTWLVDGQVVRTLHASDVTDNTTGTSRYPNTPSRVELSIWPAGINTSAQGTIQWAGGMINWNDSDYTNNGGHFYALVSSLSITCNDPTTPGANVTSYVYAKNSSAYTPTILFSNESTIGGALGMHTLIWSVPGSVVAALVAALLGLGFSL